MPMLHKKGRRYVRKELLWSRATSYPFDLILWANEVVSSTPWDDYADSIALPGGYLLSLIYLFLIKIGTYDGSGTKRRQNPVFLTDQFDYERIRAKATNSKVYHNYSSVVFHFLNILAFVLLAVSIVNAVNLFSAFKNYTLLYLNPQNELNTPSARKITLTNNNSKFSTWEKIFASIYHRIGSGGHSANEMSKNDSLDSITDSLVDQTTLDEINLIEKDVWELSVWDPSKFRVKLAASFSPVTALFIYVAAEDLPLWKLLLIGGLFSFGLQLLSNRFLVLLQDKQIMYQQMFSEYNDKFVKPKTSVLRKDVVIDATYGPKAPAVLTVKTDLQAHLQTQQLKVFVTHDINGKPFNNVSVSKRDDSEYEKWLLLREQQNAQEAPLFVRDPSVFHLLYNGLHLRVHAEQPLESPFKSPLRRGDNVYLSTPYRQQNLTFDRLDVDRHIIDRSRLDRDRSAFFDKSLQYDSERFDQYLRSTTSPRRFERSTLRSPQRPTDLRLPNRSPQRSPQRPESRIGLNELKTPFERELSSRRLSIRSPSPVKRWK